MLKINVRLCVVYGSEVFLFFGVCEKVAAETESQPVSRKWGIALYYSWLNDGTLGETLTFSANQEDASLLVLALSRESYSYRDWFSLGFEGQVGKQFQEQDHWEFNFLGTLRWIKFPWNNFVDTSLAAGAGVSYASEEPEIEFKKHGKVSRFLGYLMFETAFSLPSIPRWDVFARIHYRSGAGGLFNDVKGGSNAYGVGLRYKF